MKKGFQILILMAITLVFFSVIFVPTWADSGFDYSYDGGGYSGGYSSSGGSSYGGFSSGGSSSWDHDYSHGSSSYSSVPLTPLNKKQRDKMGIYAAIFFILFSSLIILDTKSASKRARKQPLIYTDITEENIKKIDANLDLEKLKTMVFEIYRDIQYAWRDFDTDTLRLLTTDELYNMYVGQLQTLKDKNEKNIMKDISLEKVKIINIALEDNIITLDAYLRVKTYDYIIDETTNKVKRGFKDHKAIIDYEITFVKSGQPRDINKCPNCGAPIEVHASAVCAYCDSTIVCDATTFVMSKKKVIKQDLE